MAMRRRHAVRVGRGDWYGLCWNWRTVRGARSAAGSLNYRHDQSSVTVVAVVKRGVIPEPVLMFGVTVPL